MKTTGKPPNPQELQVSLERRMLDTLLAEGEQLLKLAQAEPPLQVREGELWDEKATAELICVMNFLRRAVAVDRSLLVTWKTLWDIERRPRKRRTRQTILVDDVLQHLYLSNRKLPETRAQLIAEVFAEIKNRKTSPKDTPSSTTIVRRAKLLRLIPSKP
jgi:hypothetical protein